MERRAVVALRVVLEDQLPVGRDLVLDPVRDVQRTQIPTAELADERSEGFLERLGVRGQIEEDPPLPQGQGHRPQRIVLFAERLDLVHERGAGQLAVERIGPRVVAALNGLRKRPGRLVDEAGPAVAADVVVRVDVPRVVSEHDDTFRVDVEEEIRAGLG